MADPLDILLQAQPGAMTTNQTVVVWVRGKTGQKVKTGECWDLAEEALKHAKAYTSRDLGPVKANSDYIWGTKVTDVKDVIPGDILQFRNYTITITTETDVTFKDGSGWTQSNTETETRAHHTAVVNGKPDAHGVVKTLEQNIKPKGKIVQDMVLHTRDVPQTKTKTFEKLVNKHTKKLETATVVRTVTVKVTGTIWSYRPKPKPAAKP